MELILNCFHLCIRVQRVEQIMHGLCALEPPPLVPFDQARIDMERLRHPLWNGHHDKAYEALARITS